MDTRELIGQLIFPVTLLVVFAFLWSGGRRQAASLKVGIENTRAVEENTAAIRDLIQKLDERAR